MKNQSEGVGIERQLLRFDAVEALRQALDDSYRRMREGARQSWQRHLAEETDPSDSCVAVRCCNFLSDSRGRRRRQRRFSQ